MANYSLEETLNNIEVVEIQPEVIEIEAIDN